MELRLSTEPHRGAVYADLRAVAQAAHDGGFAGFFRSDHVMWMGFGDGMPGPSDALVTLAALAVEVPEIRLGTLVTSATFRHPAMLAIAAANIDEMSGGRLELGMGAGWHAGEHVAHGLPFGSGFAERFDRLTEQLEILTGLWATPPDGSFDYDGQHYTLAGAPGRPKPTQRDAAGRPKVPIIMGGSGPRRTPALAARFADDFNVNYIDLGSSAQQIQRVRAACEEAGRDPDSMVYSAAQMLCCGRTDDEVARRAVTIGRTPAEAHEQGLAGSPAQLVDAIGRWAEIGVRRMYLQVLDLHDFDHIELVAAEVLPQVQGGIAATRSAATP